MAKPNEPTGKFPGRYVYTVGDPSSADVPPGTGVAMKYGGTDGATLEQIKNWIASHPNEHALIWAAPVDGEDAVTTYRKAAAVANQVGASGFIAQGESPEQMNAAAAVTNDVHIPKAIVTNGDQGVRWPAGWGIDFEYYPNTPGNGMNPQNMAGYLKSVLQQGASFAQVTGGSWNDQSYPMPQYQSAINYLRSQGINVNGFSIYIWNSMTPEQKQAFLTTSGVPAGPAAASAQPSLPGQTINKPQTKNGSGRSAQVLNPDQPMGINGPHTAAGADGAPRPYAGGASIVQDPAQTFSFTGQTGRNKGKRITITTTATGAKIEQVEGESAYQIKKPTQPARTPITNPSEPAWHQNDAWATPTADTAAKAHVAANTVLEQRPGADGTGNTVLRIADGTYKILHADGTTSYGGTWNKDQWKGSQNTNPSVPAPAAVAPAPPTTPTAPTVPTAAAPSQPQNYSNYGATMPAASSSNPMPTIPGSPQAVSSAAAYISPPPAVAGLSSSPTGY